MSRALIEYSHVTIAYGEEISVRDVSFKVEPGQVLCIVGESGSGKSTLLKAAAGLLGNSAACLEGDIYYEGMNLPDISAAERQRISGPGIAMAFQNASDSFMPLRSIGAQIYEALAAHEALSREESDRRVAAVLARLGFGEPGRILGARPFELSGGMNQRVGLALSFILRPKLLLADEPTSALDALTAGKVLEELRQLRQETGTAIILVTHDMAVAGMMADEILVLRRGRVEEYGRAEEVLAKPRSAYTGQLLAAVPRLKVQEAGHE